MWYDLCIVIFFFGYCGGWGSVVVFWFFCFGGGGFLVFFWVCLFWFVGADVLLNVLCCVVFVPKQHNALRNQSTPAQKRTLFFVCYY